MSRIDLVANESISGVKQGVYDKLSSEPVRYNINDVSNLFSQVSIVGINANKVPAMKDAIVEYVNEVKMILNNLENYNPEIAFKGEIVTALREYIESIKIACNNICSMLYGFADQLSIISEAYTSIDRDANWRVNNASTITRDSFNGYPGYSNQ